MEPFSNQSSRIDRDGLRARTARRAIAGAAIAALTALQAPAQVAPPIGASGVSGAPQPGSPARQDDSLAEYRFEAARGSVVPTPGPAAAEPSADGEAAANEAQADASATDVATPGEPKEAEPTGQAPAAAEEVPQGGTSQPTRGPSPITVEADTLEVQEGGATVRATGSVIVEWDTTKLRAGEITVHQQQREVEATGGIVYESDELRATASEARVDVDDETGVFEDVNMNLAGEEGRFGGSRLEKAEGRHVILEDGYFTTCDVDRGHAPDWELRGKTLDVRFDDYARMRNARLEVRGVPVLYLPYVVFPTKLTRQSGLMSPSFGTSSNRGFLFTLPGYWAIDKHRDLTATAVVETSARIGIDGLYRYAPSRRRWGELHAAFYNEDIRGEPKPESPAIGVPENRGVVELLHREYFRRWTGYADVQWVGDERFLREIHPLRGDTPERDYRRTQRYTLSRVGAFASSGFTTGGVDAVAYQDLYGEEIDDGDDTTTNPVLRDTQQKPFQGWVQNDGSLGPVAYAIDSSLVSYLREKGASGERLDVASRVALPLLTRGPVTSRAWAGARGSAYAMHQRDVLDDEEQVVDRLDRFPTRGIFDAGIDTRSKFARDYALEGSERWTGLYHSLEPFAAIHYTNRSSYDDIPLFDRLDAISGRDVATYGIDSRFLLRRRPAKTARKNDPNGPFELARLSLSQSYNLTREVIDDHFSDIDIAAFVQPIEGLAVRTLTSWSVGESQVSGANASISWETGPVAPILRGPSSQIAAAYRYVRNTTDVDDVLQSTELLARLGLTRRFAVGLRGLYDIVGNTFVEKAVGVTFTAACDCWSLGLGVIERVNPSIYGVDDRGSTDELQVRLAFELKGLGGLGGDVTQRNSPALSSVAYEDVGFWRAGW